jgi:hypothetical protein
LVQGVLVVITIGADDETGAAKELLKIGKEYPEEPVPTGMTTLLLEYGYGADDEIAPADDPTPVL